MVGKHRLVVTLVLVASCLGDDPNPVVAFNCENGYQLTLVQGGAPRALPNVCDGGARSPFWDTAQYLVTVDMQAPGIVQDVQPKTDAPNQAEILFNASEEAALGEYSASLHVVWLSDLCNDTCSRLYDLKIRVVEQGDALPLEVSLTANAVPSGESIGSGGYIQESQSLNLHAMIAGGVEPFTYEWSALPLIASGGLTVDAPEPEIAPENARAEPPVGEPVVYTVRVTDGAGSEGTASFIAQRSDVRAIINPDPIPESIHYGTSTVTFSCDSSALPEGYTCGWLFETGDRVEAEVERSLLTSARAQAEFPWRNVGGLGGDFTVPCPTDNPLLCGREGVHRVVLTVYDSRGAARAQATRVFVRRY